MNHAKVLTVSDGVVAGTRDDGSGRALVERLTEAGFEVDEHRVVADGVESVRGALVAMSERFSGLIITTGGTGFGPRDLTPEGTRAAIEREAPGLAEAVRELSNRDGQNFGLLSRGVAGTRGAALIVNAPGSRGGALDAFTAIEPAVAHALDLLAGGHPH
ncbi:MAG TPA: MogA/MoaB family molybdenum cofactor biosynthesis protein [Acidimicrobiia bacterium]|jgi:molybdenum cofactor synthesis domain-containing protein